MAGGITLDALIDTGIDSEIHVPRWILNQLIQAGHAQLRRPGSVLTLRGEVEVRRAIVRKIDFAGVTFSDIVVSESETATVGLGLFEHFNTVLDSPERQAWFDPMDGRKVIPCPRPAA